MFKYLGKDERTRQTGVEKDRLRDLEAPERTRTDFDDEEANEGNLYVPDGPAIGVVARALQDPERFSERDRLAGMSTLYSAQRRRPVALARKREFEPVRGLGGLWRMPPLQRKTASIKARRAGRDAGSHVVPLPAQAWAVVSRAMELAGDSPWLFPGSRSRRAGMAITSMHPSRVTEILGEVPGNLASPHDVRRAFGTSFAGEARLPIERVKEILDHGEGFESGDVTRDHYSFLTGSTPSGRPCTGGATGLTDGWRPRTDPALPVTAPIIPRTAAALTLCLAAVSAAAMDKDASYLATTPLTRLDWFDMHGTQVVEDWLTINPKKPGDALVRSRLTARNMALLSAMVRYYLAADRFMILVDYVAVPPFWPEDYHFALDETRATLVRLGAYGFNIDMKDAESRAN